MGALAVIFLLGATVVQPAHAQTEAVRDSFTNASKSPVAPLIMDSSGNLYSTASVGGGYGHGVVFELVNSSGSYTEKILYSFAGPTNDGENPEGIIADSAGNLYGITQVGGSSSNCTAGCGIAFELVNSAGTYTEKVLHSFGATGDGGLPIGGLIMDAAGNLYGTTFGGGANGQGTVFELVNSSGSYAEYVLHTFAGSPDDGASPYAGLLIDASGNLYGTTIAGGASGDGTVFEISNASAATVAFSPPNLTREFNLHDKPGVSGPRWEPSLPVGGGLGDEWVFDPVGA